MRATCPLGGIVPHFPSDGCSRICGSWLASVRHEDCVWAHAVPQVAPWTLDRGNLRRAAAVLRAKLCGRSWHLVIATWAMAYADAAALVAFQYERPGPFGKPYALQPGHYVSFAISYEAFDLALISAP